LKRKNWANIFNKEISGLSREGNENIEAATRVTASISEFTPGRSGAKNAMKRPGGYHIE